MNITGVDFVAVPTRDWEKAKDFYGETLGLERSKRCLLYTSDAADE